MRSMTMRQNKRTALMMKAIIITIVAIGFRVFIPSASAAVYTWNANTTGDWFQASNWTNGVGYPGAGDVAQITNIGSRVILTNSVGWLSSLTIGGAASQYQYLFFSNWDTCLSATNIIVASNGYITCAGPFTNGVMSNRVYVACSNLTVNASGYITVSSMGYAGGTNETDHPDGYGPGGGKSGTYGSWGGSYGGAGAAPVAPGTAAAIQSNYCYGSANAPLDPGSGGGFGKSSDDPGRAGGGAIRINASGSVAVSGSIQANGGYDTSATYAGAGSGGSIYITCNTLSGTNGTIYATANRMSTWGCGGGGGRIAVNYNPAVQSNCSLPQVTISVAAELNGYGDLGTLWFPDAQFLTTNITRLRGQIIIPGFTNWAPASLTISNCWIRFPVEGFQLNVAGDFVIRYDRARYDVGGTIFDSDYFPRRASLTMPVLTVGGNLILTNLYTGNCGLSVFSCPTNAGEPDYGALVSVTGDVYLYNGTWISSYSHPTNGGAPLFRMQSLVTSTNSGFRSLWGYRARIIQEGLGPGGGTGTTTKAHGGSYGGRGGDTNVSAAVYGNSNAPVASGSAGGTRNNSYTSAGGVGGGLIRIEAQKSIILNGTLNAGGGAPHIYSTVVPSGAIGGGGSGGGIYVRCRTFVGSTNALLTAAGAAGLDSGGGGAGGGGGGRIAIWREYDESTGACSLSVTGGAGGAISTDGDDGTIVWGWIPHAGTIFMFR